MYVCVCEVFGFCVFLVLGGRCRVEFWLFVRKMSGGVYMSGIEGENTEWVFILFMMI